MLASRFQEVCHDLAAIGDHVNIKIDAENGRPTIVEFGTSGLDGKAKICIQEGENGKMAIVKAESSVDLDYPLR